jgi:hypothetical protein
MPVSKLLVTAVVVGLVVDIYDFLIHGILLQGALYSKLPLMRPDAPVPLLIVNDFVAAVVIVWAAGAVTGALASRPAPGAGAA